MLNPVSSQSDFPTSEVLHTTDPQVAHCRRTRSQRLGRQLASLVRQRQLVRQSRARAPTAAARRPARAS